MDQMLAIQCTLDEIAGVFGCSHDTIERRVREHFDMTFAEYSKQKRGLGKMSLRRSQWKKATEENNTTMQIWLGKQYLGQRDKWEHVEEKKEEYIPPPSLNPPKED